jgi:hypothetical protein
MRNGKREISDVPLPATLVYTTAMTCGVLAAIAVQLQLNRSGFDLIGLWKNLSSTRAMQLRTAGPWWAIAGLAFIVGGITAAALSRFSLPWRRFRLLRWAAGAAIVFLLADIGQHSAGLSRVDAGANTAADLGALLVAALMALCGAYFTVRR